MNTKYKNLLFDADQTLIDFEKDMPLAFQYMYEQSGLAKQKPYSAEILRLYNDCNESWWRRFEQKLCTKAELYRNRFVDFFEVAGLTPVSIDFLQDLYVSGIAKTGTPLPGALDMLCAFRALRPLHHHKRKPDLAARSPQEFRRHGLYEGLLYFR